jgi:cell division transport system ATP-binding protein
MLADEPTGNLDPATSAGIMNVLSRINASGTTVIMATHDSGIVDQMKRRVIEIAGGRVVRDEHQGAYETSAIPLGEMDTAPIPVITDEMAVADPTPIRAKTSSDPDDIASPFPWELRA